MSAQYFTDTPNMRTDNERHRSITQREKVSSALSVLQSSNIVYSLDLITEVDFEGK